MSEQLPQVNATTSSAFAEDLASRTRSSIFLAQSTRYWHSASCIQCCRGGKRADAISAHHQTPDQQWSQ
jgi:hypothetical protein